MLCVKFEKVYYCRAILKKLFDISPKIWLSSQVRYPAGYPVSGFWIGRISGKNSIRCIPIINTLLLFSVFEESKVNEVVAEIRLLKELQNSNDIGKKISYRYRLYYDVPINICKNII
jgi:hypothetical protein